MIPLLRSTVVRSSPSFPLTTATLPPFVKLNRSSPAAPFSVLKFVKSAVTPPVIEPSFSPVTENVSAFVVPCSASLVPSPVKSSIFENPAAPPLLSAVTLPFPRSTS